MKWHLRPSEQLDVNLCVCALWTCSHNSFADSAIMKFEWNFVSNLRRICFRIFIQTKIKEYKTWWVWFRTCQPQTFSSTSSTFEGWVFIYLQESEPSAFLTSRFILPSHNVLFPIPPPTSLGSENVQLRQRSSTRICGPQEAAKLQQLDFRLWWCWRTMKVCEATHTNAHAHVEHKWSTRTVMWLHALIFFWGLGSHDLWSSDTNRK